MSSKWRSAYSLGLDVRQMRRKVWLIRTVTGLTTKALRKAVRDKLISRMRDGFLPYPKDFFKLCILLDLEPEDFTAPESVFIEKLRTWRRGYLERRK